MALPGLYLPPHFVFRKNVPRISHLWNLFFVSICYLHTLTQCVQTSCHCQGAPAAGPAPWWGVGTGLCRPPCRPLKLPVLRTGPGGPFPALGTGAVPRGRGTGSLLTGSMMPFSLQGAAPLGRVPLGQAPSLREAVYPASLIRVHSGGLWCPRAGRPGSWLTLQVRLG